MLGFFAHFIRDWIGCPSSVGRLKRSLRQPLVEQLESRALPSSTHFAGPLRELHQAEPVFRTETAGQRVLLQPDGGAVIVAGKAQNDARRPL